MSEPSEGLRGIAARRRAYEREMAAPKRPSKFWSDCALWHEAETLGVLEAARALDADDCAHTWVVPGAPESDAKSCLEAGIAPDEERCCRVCRVIAAIDLLDGKREPLDGDA